MNYQVLVKDVTLYGPYVIAAAAAAMAVLPQGKPGSLWDQIRTIVNYLAMNWGHSTNVVEFPSQKGEKK